MKKRNYEKFNDELELTGTKTAISHHLKNASMDAINQSWYVRRKDFTSISVTSSKAGTLTKDNSKQVLAVDFQETYC